MALKTFNVDSEAYKEFSEHCKKEGISMSKKVEKFIKGELVRIKGRGSGIRKVMIEKKPDGKDLEHSFQKYC